MSLPDRLSSGRASACLQPGSTCQPRELTLPPAPFLHVYRLFNPAAVTLLAQYIASPSESILDSLRDVVIELEDAESTPQTSIAKAAAATAFVRAGELEEAVDVLTSEDKSLEW